MSPISLESLLAQTRLSCRYGPLIDAASLPRSHKHKGQIARVRDVSCPSPIVFRGDIAKKERVMTTVESTPAEKSSQKALARLRVAEGIRSLLSSEAPANLMALAQLAPLASGKKAWITRQVCGPLADAAESCFGRHAAILGLVESSLRQVIFACLAEISRKPDAFTTEDRARFAADALTLTTKNLISSVFGKQPPRGLVKVVSALGESPRPVEVYHSLWKILERQPDLARSLAHEANRLDDDEIQIIVELPRHADAIAIAKKFGSLGDLRTFLELYEAIRKQAPDRSDLDLIARGASPCGILRKHYQALPFPAPPPLPGLETFLEFLPNGRALAEAAKRLDNCGRNWIAEALRGSILFYTVKGEVPAMLSIERDTFGLRLKEMKCKGNEPVDFAVARKLETELSRCGVRIGLGVEDHLSILELGYNENEDEEFGL